MIEELKLSIPRPAEVTLEMLNDVNEKLDDKISDLQTMVDRHQDEAEIKLSNHEGRLKALEFQVDLLR